MKTSTVRVTRTITREIVEYIDVTVVTDVTDIYPSHEVRAEKLVKAQIDCGDDIDWENLSDKELSYPRPTFETEIILPPPLSEADLAEIITPPPPKRAKPI